MLVRVDTECLKGGQNHKDVGPPMPQGEGQVHEQLIAERLGRVILLDDVVDIGDGCGDQKGEDECDDVMMIGPYSDEDGVEDGEEGESP